MARYKKRQQEYEADGGFIADDDDGSDTMPKSKKPKTSETVPAKVAGSENGETFWELSDKRRVAISVFAGKTMVNVREYYEKDGQKLPGKKGLSMTVEQFSTLISVLPEIESALAAKGESLPRPDYSERKDEEEKVRNTDEEDDKVKDDVEGKKNFEETSDEG